MRILGAGLSGLTAATVLARAGRKVDVLEVRADCGARFHGDLQGIENWSDDVAFVDRMKAWGIALPGLWQQAVHEVDLFSQDLVVHRLHSARPAVHLVRRGTDDDTLDQAMMRGALDAGVRIHFSERVDPSTCDIIATGPDRATGYVYGELFETDAHDRVVLSYRDADSPGGYGYLIVAEGRGLIATVVLRASMRPETSLRNIIHTFERVIPGIERRRSRRFGGLGHFGLQERYCWNGRPIVGEAAGLQDALWGFGMRHAITSGRLAALSLLGELDYEAALSRSVLPQVRSSAVTRMLFDRLGQPFINGLVRAWLGHQRLTGDGLSFIGWMYREGALRRLLLPLARRGLRRDDRARPEVDASWLPLEKEGGGHERSALAR